MAAEEDILLREIDDDLKQDQALAFFKKHGPMLGGAAALVVASVGGLQIYRSVEAQAAARNAETYSAAVTATAEDQASAATILLGTAEETGGGYAGLARLRAASFLAQSGDVDGAVAALSLLSNEKSLPNRIRDVASLRAAYLLIDADPARAKSMATSVTSEAMKPLVDEVIALSELAMGNYEAAYDGLSALANQDLSATLPSVAQRARLMAPVADAARRGVSLEPELSEADAFIQSFSDQLNQELEAQEPDPAEPTEEQSPPGDDNH